MSLFPRIRNAITERLKDYRRERMIRECEALVSDTTNSREKRKIAFAMLAECIRERSPRQIRKLEIRKFGRSFLQ